MADAFNMVFQSFWTFAGTAILLAIIVRGIAALGGRR
ncbi:hypothetical protein phi2LM21_p07 [Sinorhizobium phage phi2LM21]|nr:hypothetical protein phi2LM21_p07 [Sinorhizobium phage phi2LM21]